MPSEYIEGHMSEVLDKLPDHVRPYAVALWHELMKQNAVGAVLLVLDREGIGAIALTNPAMPEEKQRVLAEMLSTLAEGARAGAKDAFNRWAPPMKGEAN